MGETEFFCTETLGINRPGSYRWSWGHVYGISYGTYKEKWNSSENVLAKLQNWRIPSKSIYAADSGQVDDLPAVGMNSGLSKSSSTQTSTGMAWPRYNSYCNVLWADLHVGAVLSSSGTAAGLYAAGSPLEGNLKGVWNRK